MHVGRRLPEQRLHGLVRPAERDGPGQPDGPGRHGALYSDADALEGFYPVSSDFKPEQTIATWVDNAAGNGPWPKVCAPLPPAS